MSFNINHIRNRNLPPWAIVASESKYFEHLRALHSPRCKSVTLIVHFFWSKLKSGSGVILTLIFIWINNKLNLEFETSINIGSSQNFRMECIHNHQRNHNQCRGTCKLFQHRLTLHRFRWTSKCYCSNLSLFHTGRQAYSIGNASRWGQSQYRKY